MQTDFSANRDKIFFYFVSQSTIDILKYLPKFVAGTINPCITFVGMSPSRNTIK